MEDYKKKYEDLITSLKKAKDDEMVRDDRFCVVIDNIVPKLKESEDERIRKGIIKSIGDLNTDWLELHGITKKNALAWLEKQCGQKQPTKYTLEQSARIFLDALSDTPYNNKPVTDAQVITRELLKFLSDVHSYNPNAINELNPIMIQWKGDNLKEVIDFTGKDKNFEKWFKSFEEYEQYVQKHNGIFKLFNADGSHYEVPIGAWIVKTPDGHNFPTTFTFKQKSVDKSDTYPPTLDEAIDLYYYSYGNEKGGFNWLSLEKFRDIVKTFVDDYGNKNFAEWSEEDEKLCYDSCAFLNNELPYVNDEHQERIKKCICWLKFLANKATSQPKQNL